jgi:alpha-beta hydrolase superfamily lysophospholipase
VACSRVVVLLPGNPGEAIFYDDVAARLRAHGHTVTVCGPAPLSPALDAAGLRGYAEHHARTVGTRHREEVVLVGHSVGAYFAHLIVAHGLLPVSRVFMLFPFLARPKLGGRLVLAAASARRLERPVLALLRAFPAAVLRLALGAGELAAAAREALHDDRARAWLALARTERREIAAHPDAAYLFAHPLFRDPARFAVLLAAHDRWVSRRVEEQLAPFAHRLPATHAFVIDPEGRRLVVDRLHELLAGDAAQKRTLAPALTSMRRSEV